MHNYRRRFMAPEGDQGGSFNVNSSADLSKLLFDIDKKPEDQTPPADTKPADDNTDPGAGTDGTPPAGNTGEGTPPAEDNQPPAQQPIDGKAGAAFAAMRTENKKYLTILQNIGRALEINAANDNDLIAKLADDAVTKIAQKTNVPKEMLQEFETMKTQLAAQNAERMHATNLSELQSLTADYQLTKEEVIQFATTLHSMTGVPWNQHEDIRGAFLKMNEKLIRERSARFATKANDQADIQKKIDAANQHSSKAQTGGKTETKSDFVINDSKGLTNLLSSIKV